MWPAAFTDEPREIYVLDPEEIPGSFEAASWRVLRDGVAHVTVFLSTAGAWTQLPTAVADQLLDRGPGGRGVPPRGLVYLLARVAEAGWTGPFEISCTARAVADTATWTARRRLAVP